MDWAMDWNRFVDEIERGDRPMCGISRKHANHLENYFKRYFAKSNAHTTLHNIRRKDERLRDDIRETHLGADHYMIGEPSRLPPPPITQRTPRPPVNLAFHTDFATSCAVLYSNTLTTCMPNMRAYANDGQFKNYHTKTACNVLEAERHPPCFCDVFEDRKKRRKRRYHM